MKLLLVLTVFLLSSIGTTVQAKEIDTAEEIIIINWNMNLAKNTYIKDQDIKSTESTEVKDQDIKSTESTEVKDQDIKSTESTEVKDQDIKSTESTEVKDQDIKSTESTEVKEQDIKSTESVEVKDQDIKSNENFDNETIIIHWTADLAKKPYMDSSKDIEIFENKVIIDGKSYSQEEFIAILQQAELNPMTSAEMIPSDSDITSRGLGALAGAATKFTLNMVGGFMVEKIAEEIIIYAGDKIIDSSSWLFKTIQSWYYEILY